MTLQVEEVGLLKSDLGKNINLFLGAGFSTLAGSAVVESLPVGDGLKNLLISKFGLHSYSALDLPSLYAVLLSDRRDALRQYLEEVFTVTKFDSKYDSLRKLDIEFLYTTNIDDLPYLIFDSRPGDVSRVLHDTYLYGAPRQTGEAIQYITLHGSVRHEDADFLFTSGQISAAFASDRETWYVFQRELQARPTFFVGYGMRDAGVLQALHDSTQRVQPNRWILLREEEEGAVALYKSLGFHVLIGETDAFLDYISSITSSVGRESRPAQVERTGSIPSAALAAKRPIRSFFLGAEPEWSDAYSNQVVRRRINSAIKNSIYTGKHVAIVGLPLSGKTTILKQIAVELAAERTAIYLDRISEPQADKIAAEYADSEYPPIVFIDNLIDSRDAIAKLVTSIGAQIVSTEQSIYFDSVSLRSLSGNLDVHSCSEIGGQDLQNIIDSIPADIRRWRADELSEIEVDVGDVGLFEAFRRHVFDENLVNRFRTKLAEFESRDPEAFDVYIMACYVAACRTIVSFDMIYMFIEHPQKQYGDVYDITNRIKSFLAEIDLPDDPHQDYFSVRSGALARVALKECQARSFGRVFDRFHSAVPTRVIVDYISFRRYAYDNDFVRRAYPRVQDGLRFYERLVKDTENPYDYQHGAIYLSKLKSFPEAFSWIDNAMSKSKGRVFSIRNTHARILFEANIDVLKKDPSNRTALDGINQSMEVLEWCIDNDSRRSYHLLRFSDQALQYAEFMNDRNSLDWLSHSRNSLEKMVEQATVHRSRESYNLRKYRNLLSQVSVALTTRSQ